MIIRTAQELAAVVREQRERLGWSQAELATRVGVGRFWVLEFEKGKPTAQLGNVLRTLNALGIPFSVLINDEEAPPSDSNPEPLIDLNELLEGTRYEEGT